MICSVSKNCVPQKLSFRNEIPWNRTPYKNFEKLQRWSFIQEIFSNNSSQEIFNCLAENLECEISIDVS